MQKEIRKKEKAPKPKYNMLQNAWFMIKLAWTAKEKKVIILSLLVACLAVTSNLVNLYLSPTILAVVERQAPVSELVLTIVLFVVGMMLLAAASAYVNTNTIFGRITLRTEFIALINTKASTTSYPNIDDGKFSKLRSKASEVCGNNAAATEAIWGTLSSLTQNILGFAIYVAILSSVQPLLLLVILATTTVGYFINRFAF